MTTMRRGILVCTVAMATFATGIGQEIPKTITGGVLNGKAVSLPKPEFPGEAKAAGVSGVVKVAVTINESGIVDAAQAIADDEECDKQEAPGTSNRCTGLRSLRIAGEAAALQARFSPTLLSGNPVKVKGVIVYNFVASHQYAELAGPGGTVLPGTRSDVLNGRAVELPDPVYPNAARAVGATGLVSVAVVIDEAGKVIGASAVSGHPLLRAAAVSAARAARFAPTVLEGQPVRVKGTLTYNFVLPPTH